MENTKFKKGQRIVITNCKAYQTRVYKYKLGYTGTINENTDFSPFIVFDKKEANYTTQGTAVDEKDFKITNNA